MWKTLTDWQVLGWTAAILIGAAFGVLSMTPPAFRGGRWLIAIAALLLIFKTGTWLLDYDATLTTRLVSAFFTFGMLGAAWLGMHVWITEREAAALSIAGASQPTGDETSASSSSPRFTPPLSSAGPTSQIQKGGALAGPTNTSLGRDKAVQPIPPVISVRGLVDAIGSVPRFPLGGSLDQKREVSFGAQRRWYNTVPDAREVMLDWSNLGGVVVTVELKYQASGMGRAIAGLRELERDVIVATSNVLAGRRDRVETTQFVVPSGTGRRTYRLEARNEDEHYPFINMVGDLVLRGRAPSPPERRPLGGDLGDFFQPVAEPLHQRVPQYTVVEVDWSVDTDMYVVVEGDLIVSSPTEAIKGSATARITDTADGVVVASHSVRARYEAQYNRRPRPAKPVAERFQIPIPRATGVHRYQLEVDVTAPGIGVAAKADILIYR